MAKDYYETLGVGKNATREEVKKAYKKLAKQCHPDVNKEEGSAEKFKEINEAAAVLGDPEKRKQYDQFGSTDGYRGFSGADFSDFASGSDFGSIFESFFGGMNPFGGGHRSPTRGSSLRFDMDITLDDVAAGVVKKIVIPKLVTCTKCSGSGAASDSDIERCKTCNGSGVEKVARRTPFGIFATSTTCSTCGGHGEVIKEPCVVCDGNGRIEKKKRLEIQIPAGVQDGMKLRVSGEGEAGEKGAPEGDLFVVVHVLEHDLFERHGDDIYLEVPISFSQAALGDQVEVPTLEGKAKLKIPAGTQPETIFRMRGKGIPALQGFGKGDQMVKVTMSVPDKLTKKQKELIEELEKSFGTKRSKKKTLFGF